MDRLQYTDTVEPSGARTGPGRLERLRRRLRGRRLPFLAGLLALLILVDAGLVVYDAREATFNTLYVAAVGKVRMLSQRLAKAAQQASQGNAVAFKQLRDSRDEFAAVVKLLGGGGVASGVTLPPTPERVRPQFGTLEAQWYKTERNAGLVIAEERNLVALGAAVRAINDNNPALLELADEIAALSVQSGGSARQNAITAHLVMLTQRMAKNANAMLAGDVVDPEVAFLLGKDTNTFRDLLQGLLHGNDAIRVARASDAELRGKLGELESGFKQYQAGVTQILGNMQRLVNAKRATRDIFNDSEALLVASEKLEAGYQEESENRKYNFFALGGISLAAFLVLLLIGKVYLDDSRKRAEDSERQSRSIIPRPKSKHRYWINVVGNVAYTAVREKNRSRSAVRGRKVILRTLISRWGTHWGTIEILTVKVRLTFVFGWLSCATIPGWSGWSLKTPFNWGKEGGSQIVVRVRVAARIIKRIHPFVGKKGSLRSSICARKLR